MPEFEASRLAIPFLTPLRTATMKADTREVIVVRVELDGATGWGEAAPWPGQTRVSIDDAWQGISTGEQRSDTTGDAIEAAFATATRDATARKNEVPLWTWWGGARRPLIVAAAVGLFTSVTELQDQVAGLIAAGHRAIKLKVAPGHDVTPLRAVLEHFPGVEVGIDANGSYLDVAAAAAVARLGPAYFEQPFPPGRTDLGTSLRRETGVPVLADESIWSVDDAMRAITLGAADGIVVKLGRLGVRTTRRLLGWAADMQVPVKVSGLFETSIGRAHNLAVATRPEVAWVDFTPAALHLAGDVVSDPWTLSDGAVMPRDVPGIGVTIDDHLLDRYTVARHRGNWEPSVQEVPGTGEDQ